MTKYTQLGEEPGKLSSYDIKSVLIYAGIIAAATAVEELLNKWGSITSLADLKVLLPAAIGIGITTAIGTLLVIAKKLLQDKSNIYLKQL